MPRATRCRPRRREVTLLFLGIGLAAGVLSGTFGLGGGIVIVPALLFLAQMPAKTATGTSLAALLLPVGALGAWEYYRGGHLNLAAALWIALGLTVGVWFGAKLVQHVSSSQLQRAFSVFLVLVAGKLWWSA
ncbi:MAG: sulfite exporter TauE/SafE family protein [Gemmatimonadaceae bacterium]